MYKSCDDWLNDSISNCHCVGDAIVSMSSLEAAKNGFEAARYGVTSQDENVEEVRAMLLERSEVGLQKYGTTTCCNPLSLREWLQHALEETLDKAVYLRAAIRKLDEEHGN